MSDGKKENLFVRLAEQNRARETREGQAAEPPSPAPDSAPKRGGPVLGKRNDPNYCQANAYVPKGLRRAVEKALLDIDGLDYSTLVADLLKGWLESRGVPE